MRKRPTSVRGAVWLLLMALTGLALISYAMVEPTPRLPVCQGRTLYEWITAYRKADGNWREPRREQEMERCRKAIRTIGTNALPFVMADLRGHGTLWNEYQGVRWLEHRVGLYLKLEDEDRLGRGMTALKVLGPIAKPCLPELVANVNKNRILADEALLDVGAAAMPAFTDLLRKSQPPQRGSLSVALAMAITARRITPREAALAVPCLVQVYRSHDTPDRSYAAWALGAVHQQPDLCVPLLVEGLSDTNAATREACLLALEEFGDAASMYAGRIAALFNNPDFKVRRTVCMVLAQFHSAAAVAVPVLVRGSQDPDERVRVFAAIALGKLAREPQQAVPALQQSLRDALPDIRVVSAHALGLFGPRAASAVADLERSCADADPRVRNESTNALRLIQR